MKKITLTSLGMTCAAMLNAAIGLTGTSLNNATGLAADEIGVYVVTTGTAFNTVVINSGASIFDSATYGADFTVMGSATAATGFGSTTLASGVATDFSSAGNAFAIFVFEASTTTAIASDVYNVWTDASWTLSASDGFDLAFAASPTGSDIQQLSGASTFNSTVVPEPSAYAAIAGVLVLGFTAVRRRRRA